MTADSTQPGFDPADYPRRYGASAGWLIYGLLLSGIVGIFAVFAAWYVGAGHEMRGAAKAFAFAGAALAIALCTFDIADTLSFSVILDFDAIEVRRAWGKRRLQRDAIADYQFVRKRRHRGLGPRTLVLLPRGQGQQTLKLPWVVRSDPPFLRWLASLRKD